MAAVVIAKLPDGKFQVFGPFSDGGKATRFGMKKFKGTDQEWFWEDLIHPQSPFAKGEQVLV